MNRCFLERHGSIIWITTLYMEVLMSYRERCSGLIVELIGADNEVNKVVEELRTTVEVREVVDHES